MRIVISSRNSFELSCSDKFTHKNTGTSFDTLTTIVCKLHLILIELDTVTEDAETALVPMILE